MEIYKAWLEILAKIEAKRVARFSAAAGKQDGCSEGLIDTSNRGTQEHPVILSHINNNPSHPQTNSAPPD